MLLAVACLGAIATPTRCVGGDWHRLTESDCGAPVEDIGALHWGLGSMWIGTTDRLVEVREGACRVHAEQRQIRDLADDGAATLWASRGALWRYRGGEWRQYEGSVMCGVARPAAPLQQRLTGSACYADAACDHSYPAIPEVYEGVPYVTECTVGYQRLAVAADGSLWLAYGDVYRRPQPVVRFAGEELECWEPGDGAPGAALGIAAAPDGGVWVLTRGGLHLYADGAWQVRPDWPVLYEAAGGGVFLWGASPSAVFRLSGRDWVRVVDCRAEEIAVDERTGSAWVISGSDVIHVTADTTVVYPYPTSDRAFHVRIAVDGEGRVWVGERGDGRGVYYMDPAPTAVRSSSWGSVKRRSD